MIACNPSHQQPIDGTDVCPRCGQTLHEWSCISWRVGNDDMDDPGGATYYTPVRHRRMEHAMITDSRPRHLYRLPDGREVPIIFDHGEVPPLTSTFQLEGGTVVPMTLVATADNLTDEQILEYRASVLGSEALDAELALGLHMLALGLHITESSDEAYYSARMDQRDARGRIADAINARAKAVR